MPFQTDLPDVLEMFGLKVEVVPGWRTRGSSSFNPGGSIAHHTAGPRVGDRPSLRVCVEGRRGSNPLPGPLCNTFLPRSEVVVVVAAGRANHAGPGSYKGLVGNSSVFGTEGEDDGLDGQWTTFQRWAFPRVQAAQLYIAGRRNSSYYCSHRTWASPPGRKIDPTGISDSSMKEQIDAVFREVLAPKPPPKPTPKPPIILPKEEHLFFIIDVQGATTDEQKKWYILDMVNRGLFHIANVDELSAWRALGVPTKVLTEKQVVAVSQQFNAEPVE